jgi:hypothetical protein
MRHAPTRKHLLMGAAALLTTMTCLSSAWATPTSTTISTSSPTLTLTQPMASTVFGNYIWAGTHYYETQTFIAVTSDITTIDTVTLTGMGNIDFLALYAGVFDPQHPDVNLVAYSNSPDVHPNWALLITGSALTTGQTYTILFTSFYDTSKPPWDNLGSGTFSITPDVNLGYAVGGVLSGLGNGKTVVLQNNGADPLSLSANGSFVFDTFTTNGSPYAVTVRTQPVGNTCSVSNGSGTMSSANVTNIAVSCVAMPRIGGTLSGLGSGKSVTLKNNGGDNLVVDANGSFVFATPILAGNSYAVSVGAQPAGQTCTVTNGTGTAVTDVSNVGVECSNGAQPIPTLSEWGMIILSISLAGTMMLALKRQQQSNQPV